MGRAKSKVSITIERLDDGSVIVSCEDVAIFGVATNNDPIGDRKVILALDRFISNAKSELVELDNRDTTEKFLVVEKEWLRNHEWLWETTEVQKDSLSQHEEGGG